MSATASLRPPGSPRPLSPLIAEACDRLADDPIFGGEPGAELMDIADQCREPLRVAVAGDVSTGKSTLVNALLASHRAAMAREETTARVTSYRHPGLPPPHAPVSGHVYEPVSFPRCDRLILIDTPGLNSPTGQEQVTQEMIAGASRAAGATSVLLYLCKDCLVSDGAMRHVEAFAALTAGRLGWGLNVVLVGPKADSIESGRREIEESLVSEAGIPCASAVAVSQQAGFSARAGLLGDAHLDTLRTIAGQDDLTARLQYGWQSLERGWTAGGLDLDDIKRLKELTESTAVLDYSVARIRQRLIADGRDLISAWEAFSGLAALDRLLTAYADEADLFTSMSALGRLRRLSLRLGPERGGMVRRQLAGIEESAPYASLLRHEAAMLLETTALPGIPHADRAEAVAVLRDPAARPNPGLARRWEQLALLASSSLARQTAGVVVEASLHPRTDKAL
jgi:hypothetical protein